MLKKTQEKITPVEIPEWYQEAILKERTAKHARIAPRTWVLLGVLGLLLLLVVFFALMPFNSGKDQKALDMLVQESTQNQQQQEIGSTPFNQPAQDEQTVRLSVTTTPHGATIYLNEDSVGVTPLSSYRVQPGIWVLSIREENDVSFDTVLFLEEDLILYLPIRAEEPLPEALVVDNAELGEPLHQPTTATLSKPIVFEEPTSTPSKLVVSDEQTTTLSKPVVSEEPAAAQGEPRKKTILDMEQREPGQKEIPITWDPLAMVFSKASEESREIPTIETPQTETDHGDDETNAASETPPKALLPQAQAQAPADSSAIPTIETSQTETDQPKITELCPCPLAPPPQAQAQTPADSSTIPTIEAPQTETDHGNGETNAASGAQHGPISESNSQQHNTQYTRSRPPKTRVRARGEKVNIVEVEGKRALKVDEVANLRVVTSADALSPAVFMWESEDGVFAIGRSINIRFSEAGLYAITVTAKNDHGTAKETLTITVKEPPRKPPKEGG